MRNVIRIFRLLLIPMIIFCSNAAAGRPKGTVIGSCHFKKQGSSTLSSCEDYLGKKSDAKMMGELCKSIPGAWTDALCPGDGIMGGCLFSISTRQSVVTKVVWDYVRKPTREECGALTYGGKPGVAINP